MNFSRRLSRRTVIDKAERKGRRSFDTAIEYGTVAIIATEKTRTAKSAVRATCLRIQGQSGNRQAASPPDFPLTFIFLMGYIPAVEWEVEYTDEFETWWSHLSEDEYDEHLAALEREGLTDG